MLFSINEFINAFRTQTFRSDITPSKFSKLLVQVERNFPFRLQHERHCSRRRLAYYSFSSVRCWSYCFYLGNSIFSDSSRLVGYSRRFEEEGSTRLGDYFSGSSPSSTSNIRWICDWNVVDWPSGLHPTDSSCSSSRGFSGYRFFSPGYRPFQ